MSDKGFIKIPRALLQDPVFLQASPVYRTILFWWMEHARYAHQEKQFDDNGTSLTLSPGECAFSIRQLQNSINQDLKENPNWKAKDLVGKTQIEYAIKYFCGHNYTRQSTRHKKTVITFTFPWVYEIFVNGYKTTCKTRLGEVSSERTRHVQDTKKEGKDIKKILSKESIKKTAPPFSLSSSSKSLSQKKPLRPHVLVSENELAHLRAIYTPQELEYALDFLNDKIEAKGYKYKSHAAVMKKTGWVYKHVKQEFTQNSRERFEKDRRDPRRNDETKGW